MIREGQAFTPEIDPERERPPRSVAGLTLCVGRARTDTGSIVHFPFPVAVSGPKMTA
jgi:hypothetical protein